METALELTGVGKSFGAVRALSEIELTVRRGEVHCVLGENGAGKSTLCNIVYGGVGFDTGAMRLFGASYRPRRPADALRRGIAMVHQHFSLVPTLTVADNLLLAEGVRLRPARSALTTRVAAIADEFGLRIHLDALAGNLSVGERQTVEIVKCLLRQPKLMLLDEPTAVLGPAEIDALLRTCRRIADSGCAVVLVTHKLGEIERAGDTATVLRGGRVAGSGALRGSTGAGRPGAGSAEEGGRGARVIEESGWGTEVAEKCDPDAGAAEDGGRGAGVAEESGWGTEVAEKCDPDAGAAEDGGRGAGVAEESCRGAGAAEEGGRGVGGADEIGWGTSGVGEGDPDAEVAEERCRSAGAAEQSGRGSGVAEVSGRGAGIAGEADAGAGSSSGSRVLSRDELVELMVGRGLAELDSALVTGDSVARTARDFTAVAPIARVSGLRFVRGDGVPALDGIDLTLRPGEITGIAGVEGNGQSELIAALSGALRPASGTFQLGDADLTHATPAVRTAHGLGVIPEDRHHEGCIPAMSVADNLCLARLPDFRRRGLLDRRAVTSTAAAMIAQHGIKTSSPHALMSTLSGGNQQKVVIARELALDPLRCLLAAQPTRGLDLGAVDVVLTRLREAAASGAAVLVVSHELPELLTLCDRILVAYRGRLLGPVDPTDPRARERIAHLMLGTSS
ncbi:ATP-binding cassette domain-containing protein [Nocardia yamanashiensis]|uniref:ATP-binding cassette domain-containing protein n=1 Tax=Nocardia yamanashiensis TaxID=209247 RepID=UPI001E50FEE7|nr:ATP-binding cassette domain-containing protein [Nocardia yamanashiensis]UGT42120.1 ATP-binding cassette domain-containing protein [Nocardia yamanashiensis]